MTDHPRLPTMKDVARLAGVSVQTVSCVVNDRPGISEETRQRVRQIVDDLGYVPSSAARLLRGQRPRILALVLPDPTSPSFAAIASAAEQAARGLGYALVLYASHSDRERESFYLNAAPECGAEGLLLVLAHPARTELAALQERGVPYVALDAIPEGYQGPAVEVDNFRAGWLAAQHLLSLGHRRLAHLSGPLQLPLARQRQAGFLSAAEEQEIGDVPCLSGEDGWGYDAGYLAMQDLLRQERAPTGVFVASDRMAIGAIRAAREAGLEVPRDLSVIGVGDFEGAAYHEPSLTSVRLPFAQMAAVAVRQLVDMLGGQSEPATRLSLQPSLVVRRSTARPAGQGRTGQHKGPARDNTARRGSAGARSVHQRVRGRSLERYSPKERVLRACRFESLDRFPIDLTACSEAQANLQGYLGLGPGEGLLERLHVDFRSAALLYVGPPRFDAQGLPTDPLGLRRSGAGDFGYAVTHPLAHVTSVADVEAFPWPSPDMWDYDRHAEIAASYEGYAVIGVYWNGFFNYAAEMVGMQRWFTTLYDMPDVAHAIISRLVDLEVGMAERALDKASRYIDIFQTGDDYGIQTGPMLSAHMMEQFVWPYLARIFAVGKKHGKRVMLHSCGSIAALLPKLIEMGLDIIEPVQVRAAGMDPRELARRFGGKLVFHGSIDTQQTLPFGTPEDVRREVRERVETFRPYGGLTIAPSQAFMPEIPTENIVAMYEAAYEYGWFEP